MTGNRIRYGLRSRALTSMIVRVSLLPVAAYQPAFAQSVLPQGGTVSSGQASISSPSANALTIRQSSDRAVINWGSFSVGAGNSVNFVQPSASSATLNRVTGSMTSTIAGQISSNGQVFLVNPNGIFITPTGSVQTGGGFVASTLDIANADFNGGYYKFSGNGASAAVDNAGAISAGQGTYVALLGGTVSSSGTINAYLGKVGLASGEQVILNPSGDGFLQVAVPTGAVAPDGRALVDVAGRIKAAGGKIQVSAASAQDASRDVINISGNLSARTVSGSSGNITLGGGPGGNVTVTGRLSAIGGKTQQGGTVEITGSTVNLRGARINASGGTGGGTVNVGGGWQGSGPLQRATTTNVDSGTTLRADATVAGNGGLVTVWADGTTNFGGFISARGGPRGGNGGNAEVSGKTHLFLNGDYTRLPLANLKAPLGETGNLLFDPGTVNIVNQSSLNNNTALNGPDTFTAEFISSQLGSANVTIATSNATGANGSAGDINLSSNAYIGWSSNSRLTLNAARDINFAAGSSITGGSAGQSLVLQAGSDGAGIGTVKFNGGGVQVILPGGSVDIYYNPASNRTVAQGGSNNAAGTVNGTSYTGAAAAENWSSFISSAQTIRAWMLVNSVFDLQNIANALNGRFAQGKDINASATSGWNAGLGFVPLGTDGAGTVLNGGNGFAGTFDGSGHVVDGLNINRPASGYAGMFGDLGTTASVQNVGVTNASVTGGGQFEGALVGYASSGSSIANSYSTGSVAGINWVGGLVGRSGGAVTSSYSTASVSGTTRLGGLLGETNGTVTQSWASGTVTGDASSTYVGGLVGYSNGSISQSYASGAVTGNLEVGGLVGNSDSFGSISRSYATGSVTGTSVAAASIGGLVGLSDGSISESYSTGLVSTGASLGGFVGTNNGTISNSYFDQMSAGLASPVWTGSSAGVTALNTSQAFTQSSYAGWDFNNVWWMNGSNTRPFLRSEYSTTITNSHQLQMINMSSTTLGASYTLRGSLDLSETSGGGSRMWTTSGFVPLGTDGAGNRTNSNNGFTGSFDGAGNSLDALYINRSVNYVGLFGAMGTGGAIQNVGVTNANVMGANNVGALVGHSYGTVSNSFSSGAVSTTGGPNAGGLVGGQINGVIDRSYSSASVSGIGNSGMGGLLGTNNAGLVNNSYATGAINNGGTGSSGGLVGANINGGVINRSYATGLVSSSADNTGGLVGYSNGTVAESYAVGYVSGINNTGGLIGLFAGGSNTSSYFDNLTTGTSTGVGSGSSSGVTGLSTATFQNGSLPSGFSAAAWIAHGGQYPQLVLGAQVVKITATDSGSGNVAYGSTPSFSYTITDANGATLCTNNCAAYFSGTPLIDSTVTSTTNAGTSAPGYIAKGTVAAVSGYVIQFVNDMITVVGKALTITATDQSKTYGQTANLGNSAFTTVGLTNGDTVSSVTLNSAGAVNTAGVAGSPYSIIPSNAIGTGLSNYAITYANGHLTVNPAPITVTALGGTSTYGSSPANPGLSATGLQNGQTVAVLTGLSNSFGITNNTNAGSYTMNVAGILTNANYTVSGTNTGTWTVNPAPVTVTALGGSSTYGSSPSNPGLSATGLQNGQSVAVLTGLSNTFGITNNTNAGSYTMNVAGILTNGNYTVAGTNTGTWTVNPAPVTVTALGGSSTYGTSPSDPGLTATGLRNGQTVSSLTGLSNSFGITNTTNAGSYTMNVAGVLTNPNYTVSSTVTHPWTVNPAPITVTALGGNSSYGMSPANPGLSATGLQNGESTAVLTGLSNSFGITNTTNPGSYAMNVAGVLSNGNYTVTRNYSQPWTVFPAGQAVPPFIPPPPPSETTGSISSSPTIGLDSAARNSVSSNNVDGDGGLRLNAPSVSRAGGGLAAAPLLAESPSTSFAQDYSLRLPPPEPSRPSMSAAAGGDKTEDCDGTVTMSAKQKGGSGGGSGCAAKLAGKLEGAIDFTLNALTRNAVIDSVETAFTEMISAKSTKLTIAKNVTAGTTLVVTAGIIGWLLRGGALLSALLSSMPMWRTFDPLVVVQRRREDGDSEEQSSEVDQIFEMAATGQGVKA